ncbi:MAG: right-handed parallel beta-helix repeat-containing protein [Halobacteriota archaeon]
MARKLARENGNSDRYSERKKSGDAKTAGGLLNRREYIKFGAAAAGTVLATSGVGSATAEHHGMEFDRVLDAVDDLGLDNSGGQAIDSTLLDSLQDGTLIEFPDGQYLIEDTLLGKRVSNVGLVAAEGARPTLVPATPTSDLLDNEYLIVFRGSNILFGGFDLDFTRGSDYGGRVQLIAESGDVSVFDVTTKGQLPGNVDGYRVEARSKDGVATMDNVNMRDGAVEGRSATGIFVGPPHAGEIYIRNCDIWHFPSKGIYASNPAHPDVGAGGTVHVDGGLYKNNNDCDVRVGSAGSTIKNIVSVKQDTLQGETVTWEDPVPRRHWDGRTDIVQTRSIRLKYGEDVLIEGCEFSHEIGQGAGVITGEGSHGGGTTIRDCRISVHDVEIYPILLKNGSGDGFEIENVSITGTNGHGAAIRIEDGRHGTTIQNSCINLTGSGECGVEIIGSDDCVVADSNIKVDGEAVKYSNASVDTSGLTYTDSCPLPDITEYDASDDEESTTEKTLSNTCTVRATDGPVEYSITASDGIVVGSNGKTVDSSVENTVSGSLADGDENWFWFDGEIQRLELSADATFFINGEEVDSAQFEDTADDEDSSEEDKTDEEETVDEDSSGEDTTEKTLSNTCTVRATDGAVEYSITVSDYIVVGSNGKTVDSSVGNTVSGSLADGDEDWFWFDGEIQQLELSADATFFINGEEVDSAQFEDTTDDTDSVEEDTTDDEDSSGEETVDDEDSSGEDTTEKTLSNTCTVRATDGAVEYSITASDGIVVGSNGKTVDSSVENTVSGSLADGDEDWFWFDGEIQQLELSADATFFINGEEVNTALFDGSLPNVLSVDGGVVEGGAKYTIEVTNELVRDDNASTVPENGHEWDEREDIVDGSEVVGSVWDGIDVYRFSGDLARLNITGNAQVNFE